MTQELTPAGKLRVGIVFAPKMSGLFVVKDASGEPRGITVDLSRALAKELGVPIEFKLVPNSGLVTDALANGETDVAYMPVDDERRKRVEFGPYYCMIESTYMVTGPSGLKTLADVDQKHVRVVGIANTTTIRASARSLKNTQPVAATSIEDAIAMLHAGKADAYAMGRDALPDVIKEFPGASIVEGGFQNTGIAIAVQKGKPQALAAVTAFMEKAKKSGIIRQAMDRAAMQALEVAP
jgi:polar amino acid transport system substrate-binding protein